MAEVSDPGHPSVDEVADAAEGLLDPARAQTVRGHVQGCADCRRTAAALTAVTTVLATSPAPPMPAAVADRLNASLARESAHR